MPKVTYIEPSGASKAVDAPAGTKYTGPASVSATTSCGARASRAVCWPSVYTIDTASVIGD